MHVINYMTLRSSRLGESGAAETIIINRSFPLNTLAFPSVVLLVDFDCFLHFTKPYLYIILDINVGWPEATTSSDVYFQFVMHCLYYLFNLVLWIERQHAVPGGENRGVWLTRSLRMLLFHVCFYRALWYCWTFPLLIAREADPQCVLWVTFAYRS